MSISLFDKISGLDDSLLHDKFLLLRDHPNLKNERNLLDSWFKGFVDRDNKIIKEFQTTFHSTFWEIYLFQVFKSMDFDIDWTHPMPDFNIKKPRKMNIEAVVSEIKINGRKESERHLDDLMDNFEPIWMDQNYHGSVEESITRYSNAIKSKKDKYLSKYSNLPYVDNESPFVIALSSYSQVNYGRENIFSIVPLLYGMYYDPNLRKFSPKKEITKPGTDSKIKLGIFDDDDMNCLSAIIFKCTLSIGKLTSLVLSENAIVNNMRNHVYMIIEDSYINPRFSIEEVSPENPENLMDGLFVLHNPKAKNKIPIEFFEKTNAFQFWCESTDLKDLKCDGIAGNLISRLSIDKHHNEILIQKNYFEGTYIKFNYS